jgi:RNA polymerase-binding transcription factor DksA
MPYIPDAYDAHRRYEDEREDWLSRQPQCCECEKHIQDEKLFVINDCIICNSCLHENYEKDTEYYAS